MSLVDILKSDRVIVQKSLETEARASITISRLRVCQHPAVWLVRTSQATFRVGNRHTHLHTLWHCIKMAATTGITSTAGRHRSAHKPGNKTVPEGQVCRKCNSKEGCSYKLHTKVHGRRAVISPETNGKSMTTRGHLHGNREQLPSNQCLA